MLTRRNTLVLGVVALFGAGTFYIRAQTGSFDGASLTPPEALDLATKGEITLIDIRRPGEWKRSGWGKPAVPIDMRRRDFTDALDKVVKGDRSKPIALICAAGVRSARLSKRLTAAGYSNIIDIPEGMLGSKAGPGWIRRGLPVTFP